MIDGTFELSTKMNPFFPKFLLSIFSSDREGSLNGQIKGSKNPAWGTGCLIEGLLHPMVPGNGLNGYVGHKTLPMKQERESQNPF